MCILRFARIILFSWRLQLKIPRNIFRYRNDDINAFCEEWFSNLSNYKRSNAFSEFSRYDRLVLFDKRLKAGI